MNESDPESVDLTAVARCHHRLRELAEETGDDQVQAILALASAVLLHGELERAHLRPVRRFVDPAVLHELALDHAQLAEEAAYLQELRDRDAGSADVPLLASAMRARVLAHLERDERVLYAPLRRLTGLDLSTRGQ